MTLAALAEWGIQHEGHPKPVENFKDRSFDLVITVCDDAEENCPAWLGSGAVTHIGFPDPAAVRGEAEIVLAAFRAVRDGIASRVIPLLEDLEPSTPV
jgi:arsenate reductase